MKLFQELFMKKWFKKHRKNKRFSSIYLMGCKGVYKIGISNNPDKRYHTFLTGNPDIKLICYSKPVSFAYMLEAKLHRIFKNKKIKGEWFKLTKKDVINITHLLNSLSEYDYETILKMMKSI